MLGYDLLRDMVLDASRRLGGEVTWLTVDELTDSLRKGFISMSTIENRKSEFRKSRINLPRLIEDASLLEQSEPPALETCERFEGLAISIGFASGPVRIVQSPLEAEELGKGYALICSSTDPQWTPLFLNASALVLECGGSLSHGAIVAREMNLPAVVLPDATRLFREGEVIFVDGENGVISRKAKNDADNEREQQLPFSKLPPPATSFERRAARSRNIGFGGWSLILLAAWILPENWIYQPALQILDNLLWPVVRLCGRPWTVGLFAAGLALVTAVVQRLTVNNARMREVARRSRDLLTKAAALPAHSADRSALTIIAGRAHLRVIGAGLVPIGILFGLFVLSFAWLTARMNTVSPLPGSSALVVAAIDSDCRSPVTLAVNPPLYIDKSSPATRSLPPIRETLERLVSRREISDPDRADLQRYLKRGVPAQTIAWTIRCDAAGSFPIRIVLGKEQSFQHFAVFGDKFPPTNTRYFKYTGQPLRSLTVRNTGQNPGFWNTKSLFPGLDHDVSWLWIYLAVYLATWLPLRRILRLV
jgi:rifampicin phosphotransferase